MLILELRRLDQASLEVDGAVAIDDPVWEGAGITLVTPLLVEGTAEGSSSRGVWLRGSWQARVRTECRRCLRLLELEVADDLAIFFDPEASAVDEDVTLYALEPDADELDLRPLLRERLILAVPEYPVCREDCRGLCPICGADWNETECDCEVAEPDARWGPLLGEKNRTPNVD